MPDLKERYDCDMAKLKHHVAKLTGHFDTVQIFATRRDGDGTIYVSHGSGNWFASFGHVRAWLLGEDQKFRDIGSKTADDD